jgi:hypothetical protein
MRFGNIFGKSKLIVRNLVAVVVISRYHESIVNTFNDIGNFGKVHAAANEASKLPKKPYLCEFVWIYYKRQKSDWNSSVF